MTAATNLVDAIEQLSLRDYSDLDIDDILAKEISGERVSQPQRRGLDTEDAENEIQHLLNPSAIFSDAWLNRLQQYDPSKLPSTIVRLA